MPAHVGHGDASLEKGGKGKSANDVRIQIFEFHWAHQHSSGGQQAVACFKKNKTEGAVEILQASKAGVPQRCRDADGSGGNGGLSRDVCNLAPKIRRYGPCHSSKQRRRRRRSPKCVPFRASSLAQFRRPICP